MMPVDAFGRFGPDRERFEGLRVEEPHHPVAVLDADRDIVAERVEATSIELARDGLEVAPAANPALDRSRRAERSPSHRSAEQRACGVDRNCVCERRVEQASMRVSGNY